MLRSRIALPKSVLWAALVATTIAGCASGEKIDSAPAAKDAPGGVGKEALAPVLERFAKGRTGSYKVVYDFGGLPGTDVGPSRLTLAQRLPQRRTEMAPAGDEQPSAAFVGDDDGTALCRKPNAAAPWTCVRSSILMATTASIATTSTLLDVVDKLQYAQDHYGFVGSVETIAGVAATCVTATPVPGADPDEVDRIGDKVTLCASDDGAPLVVEKVGGSDEISARATSHSSDVGDADFVPPATPTG